ncbi:hypothetical protein ANANG_G00095250 [Anguilla anguilla]|uniref:Uncharacterized protein n=1 Tax=Anguilla anguilla TaxID=7936 RepID=A0A9D3S0L2_ANGAN|nr:hypothetical protein ANANG_G00095250 [Anguilla anguilla]
MPVPEPKPEGPDFKSFNRVATPFGGFDKAPRGITFKLPEVDLNPPKYPELQDPASKRPSFNRTAQGWISDGAPSCSPAWGWSGGRPESRMTSERPPPPSPSPSPPPSPPPSTPMT